MSASPGESRREPSGGSRREPSAPRGPRDPRIGKEIAGRYRILSVLGSGGLGTVYRAEDPRVGRAVAVKLLLDDFAVMPELRRRFEREAQALGALAHPNIVTINDSGVSDGMPFIVMELLEGMTLEQAIDQAPLAPARAMDILRQILRGLAYAHGKGIAHRDLKPANVFLQALPDQRDHVRLLDFGLARFLDHEKANEATLTQAGTVFGSPAYMTPEQAAGGRVDARADVYAAGIVAFEMLAGRRPFVADNRSDLFRAHMLEEVPDATKLRPGLALAPELVRLLEKAMAKTADGRFADAGAMLAAVDALPPASARLEDARADSGESAPPVADAPIVPDITVRSGSQRRGDTTGGVEIKRGPRSRWPRRFLALLLVVLAVGAGIAAVKHDWHAEPPAPVARPAVVAPLGSPIHPVPAVGPAIRPSPVVPSHALPSPGSDPWGGPLPRDLAAARTKLVAHRLTSRDVRALQAMTHAHSQDRRYQLFFAEALVQIGNNESAALEHYRIALTLDARQPPAEQFVRSAPDTFRDVATLGTARGQSMRAAGILADHYGSSAVPQLGALIEATPDPTLRAKLALLRAPLVAALAHP